MAMKMPTWLAGTFNSPVATAMRIGMATTLEDTAAWASNVSATGRATPSGGRVASNREPPAAWPDFIDPVISTP